MIIFGNRAHYSAIGGVENSIRSMLRIASEQKQRAIVVCREPLISESLGSESLVLPSGIKLATYIDEYNQNLLRRLFFLLHGGQALSETYHNLYAKHPNATVIVRHHMHVLAAKRAGFRDIRYLVPSLTINQLSENLSGTTVFEKVNTMIHIFVDGWLQSRALAMAKLFVFSVCMQDQVRQRLAYNAKQNSIKLVKPGIDSSRFKPADATEQLQLRKLLSLPTHQKLFLFVGRFVQAKGLTYLLDALATLPQDYSAVLVGEGEYESSIRDRICSLGIENRVRLVGKSPEVEKFYRACDVFVMSSTYEPFGQTILEAAACGMRIAAFGPEAGVVTATHELGLDGVINYANKLDIETLGKSMYQAMELAVIKDSGYNGKSVSQIYSWSALLDQLTE